MLPHEPVMSTVWATTAEGHAEIHTLMLLHKVMWMFVVYAAAKNHVDVHGRVLPETTLLSVASAATEGYAVTEGYVDDSSLYCNWRLC